VAGPEPGKQDRNEYCENGAKHINDEATTHRIMREFVREHSISELATKSDTWLNEQSRLTEPMVKRPGHLGGQCRAAENRSEVAHT
jgi:hypothetical protein